MRLFRRPRRLLARLRDDERGVQVVEFAIAIPALLTLGMGGIEVANYSIASIRCSQIAMTVADGAGRVRSSIDEADINEMMIGAKQIGAGVKFAENGRIILSSLEQNAAKNGMWIRWQRCSGKKTATSSYGLEGAGRTDSSLQEMGPEGNKIAALSGTAVMFVEVVYDYQPIVSNRLLGGRTMRYVSAFNVRQRTDQTLKNGSSLPTAKTSACSIYSA
jgi:Flp pilus assembly protein TadG